MKVTIIRKVNNYEQHNPLEVKPTDTIESLQDKVAVLPGPFYTQHADAVRLIHNGKQLEVGRQIQGYSIKDGDSIHIGNSLGIEGTTIGVKVNFLAQSQQYNGLLYDFPSLTKYAEIRTILMDGISGCRCTTINFNDKELGRVLILV
ncbi:MAG: hypothetical protein JSS50_03510, partial [Proteobacteria bacterium]|nr:hypothetical protein [Pseudomonadota bacterium]